MYKNLEYIHIDPAVTSKFSTCGTIYNYIFYFAVFYLHLIFYYIWHIPKPEPSPKLNIAELYL